MAQALPEIHRTPYETWQRSAVAELLRIHDEPWKHIPDWDVHRALTESPERYLEHLRARLRELAGGGRALELPPKKIFSDETGDFRVMPCVTSANGVAMKTVKVVGTNLVGRRVPDQITVGKALRLDPVENFVTHVFDACLLSSARTGACAALAMSRLAPAARRVTLIGAGRVGFYVGIYLDALLPDLELTIVDRRESRAARMAATLSTGNVRCGYGDRTAAVAAADAVVLATSSRTPLLRPGETAATCVVSVGADSEEQHELDEEWVGTAEIFMDSADALEVGDLRAWSESGALEARPRDLLDLFRAAEPHRAERRCVFVSGGSALFDNLTIDYLLAGDER